MELRPPILSAWFHWANAAGRSRSLWAGLPQAVAVRHFGPLCGALLAIACKCQSEMHFELGNPVKAPLMLEQGDGAAGATQTAPLPSDLPNAPAELAGNTVTLRATKAQGVPLHPAEADDHVTHRLPDGTRVTVLERGRKKNWLRVRSAQGQEGWVTTRYVERARSRAGRVTGADAAIAEGSPWRSPAECEAALLRGERRKRAPGVASIASWNIEWFPDGVPGGSAPKSSGTNLPWLACLIAWLDVDLIAAQELKSDPHTLPKWKELHEHLNRSTHGDWTHQVDQCPNKGRQHVGFIYNRKKVSARDLGPVASLNPTRNACGGDLRPGFAGYFRFPGGLDLHLVAVHMKSMKDRESYAKRRTSLAGMAAALKDLERKNPDPDRIIVGDFNTMGCSDCSPEVSARAEREVLVKELEQLADPLELRSGAQCSHYYKGDPGLLDHFLISPKLKELPFSVAVQPSGLCDLFACNPLPGKPPAVHREVSDHCPLILEIPDRDLD